MTQPVTHPSKDKVTEHAPAASTTAPGVAANDPVAEDTTPKWVPESAKPMWGGVSDWVGRARTASIMATPAIIVNNSSNVLGGMHVATEMLMFKSGVPGNKLVKNPDKLINWIKEPVQTIAKDIYSRGGVSDYSPLTLLRGNPIKNFYKYAIDTHDATLRTIGRAEAASVTKELSVGNPWQSRSTLVGLVIWSLSTLIPERKETEAQIEDMAKLRTLHPVKYVGERLKQGVWFPQWNEHKREMLGVGYLGIGMFSGLGAWRNRADLVPELQLTKKTPLPEAEAKLRAHVSAVKADVQAGKSVAKSVLKNVEIIEKGFEKGLVLKQGYKFNTAYFLTAVVSFIGGLPLLFALDERKAYSSYGSLVVARLPLLPWSIGSKVWNREEGWGSYLTGKLTFQVEDMLFSLIGGATKKVHADGRVEIIDHEKLKKEAIHEAKIEKARMKEEKKQHVAPMEHPGHVVSQVAAVERVVPQGVEKDPANDGQMTVAANGR